MELTLIGRDLSEYLTEDPEGKCDFYSHYKLWRSREATIHAWPLCTVTPEVSENFLSFLDSVK